MNQQNEKEIIVEQIDDLDYILDLLNSNEESRKYLKYLDEKIDQSFHFKGDDYYIVIIQSIINGESKIVLYRSKHKKEFSLFLADHTIYNAAYYERIFDGEKVDGETIN
jgi:hypothetical protein